VSVFPDLTGSLYIITVFLLAAYGASCLVNTALYLKARAAHTLSNPGPLPARWPKITVQLPVFNEKYTIERLLRAVSELNYPARALQIQVLDDSTDDTSRLVRRLVQEYKAKGVNIERLHRDRRVGFKAGALRDGLCRATGEFIAIFDADFVPAPDWLRRTVPRFADPRVGCLQTRWGHTNREYNSLTREEALAIDGHFIVEQTARSRNGLFLNFNGTAGIWRRACIQDAGGWQPDTLTEDLDLSYRAQLRGWKIEYLPDVVVPGELPSQVEAFKKQQFRWAKGSFQVVRKILPQVIKRRDLPWQVRVMAILHLTGYFVHPLMLVMLLLTLPTGIEAPIAFRLFPFAFVAGFGPPLMYLVARGQDSPPLRERLRLLPLMTAAGFGISLSTSIAVLQGLTGTGSAIFTRTPKLNESNSPRRHGIDRTYLEPISPLVWGELALGFYALATAIVLSPSVGWQIVPWMLVYSVGYFYVAGMNLFQHTAPRRHAAVARIG
jgi:cellulose synthase/poly-beta-1,6-N-acetylglucosamine synthase-like glycosyltransferase